MPSNMFIQQDKKKRLTLDVIGQLEDDLELNPLDYVKWNKLIRQVLNKDKEEQVRSVFTKYLSIFKFDSSQWCNYINYELSRGEFKKVESLFQESFPITDSVELCRLYVSYVRRVNDVITGGERARGIVIQAFEFAVNKVGLDIASGDLWNDYLDFLKTWTPSASWELQQKVDLIRKVYKKFLVVPTEGIEKSWQEYTKWENEVNPSTSNKFISEKSAEFMVARSWNTEWHNITEKKLKREINPNSFNSNDNSGPLRKQLDLYLKWIELEKKNNLDIKDNSQLEKRILYAYRQSTFSLPFVPELWFKFSKFWLQNNEEANINTSIEILSQGTTFNPRSMLISFQLAELYEKDGNFEKAKETYLNLISHLSIPYKMYTDRIEAIESRVFPKKQQSVVEDESTPPTELLTEAEPTPEPTKKIENDDDDDDDEDQKIVYFTRDEQNQIARLQKFQEEYAKQITLGYIRLMISSKRSKGMKESRLIFKQSRSSFPAIGYEFYVENALLEHYSDNKKVALKIFDLAFKMKAFSTNGKFLSAYLEYLINSNDVDNIRKLLQSSDTNISKEIASLEESLLLPDVPEHIKESRNKQIRVLKLYLKKLLKRYIGYSSNYLSLDVASSFANKYEQLFPDEDPIALFSDRYRLSGKNLIRKFELDDADDSSDDEGEEEDARRSKRRRVSKKQAQVAFNEPSAQEAANKSNGSLSNGQEDAKEPLVGKTLVTLMTALPNASYFGHASESVFNSEKLVQLLANLPNVPID
ncbi:Suf-domain-containing protein [Suhomyces tanzawaensis NRRL Y-17324]|uniref:mRNA 3'-end-processing protein RNA14 n=1 Tax=Suhomyces tanzawaensis NRRL Y-17324 TaxID=984487 RepID=A0A1E4SEZ6_9ASCO|nr:Suf-domain-containing protein [Suhomyces tanzawaensis NRRL Y-17324]ODV78094.1 Suf-domain-containing protein [Suhomyces tanzawaensis NRRL Y-17324]